MNNDIKKLIETSVKEIIDNSANKQKINNILKKHDKKIHFVPKQYRVLGGILQSMNIQFCNFIEILIKNLIQNETDYEIINKYSGKKINNFKLPSTSENLIDNYITSCQMNSLNLEYEFSKLQKELFEESKEFSANLAKGNYNMSYLSTKHDIDLLFRNKKTGIIYYVEIKYNDDHDTGKFVDINRKFIKTYSYLLNEFDLKDCNSMVPILFFFNNKKMKGNIYIPENTNIKRGKEFFEQFLSIKYEEVEEYLTTLSENDEIIKMFDDLYDDIVK